MRANWLSHLVGDAGARLRLALAVLCLAATLPSGVTGAWAQAGGDRWVVLATRTIDVRSGRASIDLRQAKGAYKALRVLVRSGAVTLTRVEVRSSDGTVHSEPRAVVLRANTRTGAIAGRDEDRFFDTIILGVKAPDGPAELVVIVIEGLQSPGGAVAMRPAPGAVADGPAGATPPRPEAAAAPELRSGHDEARRRAEEAERAELEATRKAAAEVRRKEAEAAAKSVQGATQPAAPTPRPPGVADLPTASSSPAPAALPRPRPSLTPTMTAPAMPSVGPAPRPVGIAGGSASAPVAEPWDVVPVYYGTDRASELREQRASYGSERAKRLEIGRALVTVPKTHEVPHVERPWVYRLPFTSIVLFRASEDPRLHFTLKEVTALSREAFLAAVRERLGASQNYKGHALVFLHGFNTSFDGALFRMAQIAYDLKFDGAPFVYSWPSKGAVGLSDYNYDRESTGQAEPHLRAFLELVARETGATSVSVIAHSMGNQLLLPVLRDLKRSAPPGVAIAQIILAAPDVDRDTFEYLAKEITGFGRGITMLAASSDRALEVSRRFWGGVPRAGDVPSTGPVVVAGIDTIDVTALSTEIFSLNHSGYAEKAAILSDIQLLIQTGERPPEKRLPILVRVPTAKGDYWRFPALR